MANEENSHSKKLTTVCINWVMNDFTPRRETHDKLLSPIYILTHCYKVRMEAVIEGDTINIDFIQQSNDDSPIQTNVAILNAQGFKCALVKSGIQHLPKCGDRFSMKVDISCIDENKKDYLFNDSLTLLCEFNIFGKYETDQIVLQSNTVFLAKTFNVDGSRLFNNPVLSDIEIIVGKRKYYGHKSILAMQCPFFYNMFTKEMNDQVKKEVTIENVDPNVFEQLLYFIYTATVKDFFLSALAPKIMVMANMYQLSELVSFCKDYLMINITIPKAFDVFKAANATKKADLAAIALMYLIRNAEDIMDIMGENQQLEKLEIQCFLECCPMIFKETEEDKRRYSYSN